MGNKPWLALPEERELGNTLVKLGSDLKSSFQFYLGGFAGTKLFEGTKYFQGEQLSKFQIITLHSSLPLSSLLLSERELDGC